MADTGTLAWPDASFADPALAVAHIGIDLGGTKIYGVVLDDGIVAREAKRKTPVRGGPMGVVDAIADVVGQLGGHDGVSGVGIGAPGAVDAQGVVQRAPNLPGWDQPFALGEAMSESLDGVPVAVDNDVNVGTLAELRLGAAVGGTDVLGIFVGTGVGGAVVLDGQVRRGATGVAGEIGHMIVRQGARRCGCGGRGHLEAYAGRWAMEKRARRLAADGQDSLLLELSKKNRLTSSTFAKARAAGDPVTIELLDEGVEALGTAIASCVALLDLDTVVVGGGLADRLGPDFVADIEQAARGQLFLQAAPLRVVPASLGDQGGAVGAALAAAESSAGPAPGDDR
ncbi:MAG: ROK family protein [Actinomycetota bacterium]|nr:ROK family protein [Actinomycetota bacterium]